jgi:hypothetical protein
MGDKSPKSVRRNANQKQAKNDAQTKSKRDAVEAKRTVFKKS